MTHTHTHTHIHVHMHTQAPTPVHTLVHALPHGIDLHCRVSGEAGRPVLLFLHGFPEAAFVWDELLTHFSQPEHGGYRCVAPNMRGYAPSSVPTDVRDYRAKHLVQDMCALAAIESPTQPLAALVAHDWGGAVAWNVANQQPACMQSLVILNAPHPGTFLRELQHSPAQQAASAYMNFLIRPDAQALLQADDYRRLWEFFTLMHAQDGPHAWLTPALEQRYRDSWQHGLQGPLNYYCASPLRPPHANDAAANNVQLPESMLHIGVPTCVIWGMQDTALHPALLDGLSDHVPDLTVHRLPDATHWLVHEQPAQITQLIETFLQDIARRSGDQ